MHCQGGGRLLWLLGQPLFSRDILDSSMGAFSQHLNPTFPCKGKNPDYFSGVFQAVGLWVKVHLCREQCLELLFPISSFPPFVL